MILAELLAKNYGSNTDCDWSITRGYGGYFGNDRVERFLTDFGRRAVTQVYFAGYKLVVDRRLKNRDKDIPRLVNKGYGYRGSDSTCFWEKYGR